MLPIFTAKYRAGDKSSLEESLKATKELEEAEEISEYNEHVWLSGAYMNLAFILKNEDNQRSQEYLDKAKQIIDSDPRLTIRKDQWEKLAASFK